MRKSIISGFTGVLTCALMILILMTLFQLSVGPFRSLGVVSSGATESESAFLRTLDGPAGRDVVVSGMIIGLGFAPIFAALAVLLASLLAKRCSIPAGWWCLAPAILPGVIGFLLMTGGLYLQLASLVVSITCASATLRVFQMLIYERSVRGNP